MKRFAGKAKAHEENVSCLRFHRYVFTAASISSSAAQGLVVDGYVRALVKPLDVKREKIVSGFSGGVDAGAAGDAFAFVVAHLDKRWKKDNPRTISTFFIAQKAPLKIAVGYKAYAKGNKLLAVLLDGKEILRFSATFPDQGYKGELRTAEATLTIEQVDWAKETRELTVMALHWWGAGYIDAIVIQGEGVTLVHPQTERALSEANLQQLINESSPHLPKDVRLPSEAVGLDFESEASPVWMEAGFQRVTQHMGFGKGARYGFASANVPITAVDEASWDSLRRDGVLMKAEMPADDVNVTFSVTLSNGDYEVLVCSGWYFGST